MFAFLTLECLAEFYSYLVFKSLFVIGQYLVNVKIPASKIGALPP
jgi:hypothetical protein